MLLSLFTKSIMFTQITYVISMHTEEYDVP